MTQFVRKSFHENRVILGNNRSLHEVLKYGRRPRNRVVCDVADLRPEGSSKAPQPLCLRPGAPFRHRPAQQQNIIRVGVRPRPICSSARILWGLGDRVCRHNVGRERLFYSQVGDGRIPHLVDASIAGGRVPIKADGFTAVRMYHVIQILHCSSL
jgi:hypothetical protein